MKKSKDAKPGQSDVKYLMDTLYVIGGKWKLPIILSLCQGNRRFKDIQKSLPNITSRMLSKELKELEINQIITRNVDEQGPITVHYEVTNYCKSFDSIINQMIDWGKRHRTYLKEKETFPKH